MSKKLRAGIVLPEVSFVAIESPAARVALTREALELLYTSFRVVHAGHRLQVVPNQLIEALPRASAFLRRRASNCSSTDNVTFIDTV